MGSTSGPAVLSQTDATIRAGENFSLQVNGSAKEITWASSNASVAAVKDGKVTGVAPGQANITATVDGTVLTCIVRVKA
jgi:uncharacterized protein YjdB